MNGCRMKIRTLSCVVCEQNSHVRYIKKGRRVLCQGVRLKYALSSNAVDDSIRLLCLTLKVHPCGYYDWLSEP